MNRHRAGAIARQELRELSGMGAKTEENIARSLERLGETGKERRTSINDAMRVGREITGALAAVPGVVKAAPMGSLRRFRETIGDVDVIVASSGDADAVMKALVDLPIVRDIVGSGSRKTSVVTEIGRASCRERV